jgi:O-antigen/teichoic acid export membrane protein
MAPSTPLGTGPSTALGTGRQDHVTGPAFLLVMGRTVGLIATFAIGPIFARLFTVEDIGTYRAFFLIYATLFGLAQFGMAESLYYFIPRAATSIGRYVCNAALALLGAGLLVFAGLWLYQAPIAAYFSNPALAPLLPLLGLFLTFMLVGTVLEITMISRKQHMSAALTYAASDIARTAMFVVPALLFFSLQAVFVGAVAFAAARLVAMLLLVWREHGREFRPDAALLRTQLGYAIPFALAVGVDVILISYHQYVVGGAVTPAIFAIYSTACMTIPLVDLIMTSTTSVMMVKMGENAEDRHESLGLFHDTVARLAFLIAPVAIGLLVLAESFILTLYTEKFAASIPIFMVWVLTIVPAIFAVDAFLRVYAQTRFLLVMNLVRLAFVAGLIGWFMGSFGLVGAVLVTLIASVAARGLALVRIAQLLQVRFVDVLPWAAVGRIFARAAVAGVPAWLVAQLLGGTPWLAFGAGGAVYAVAYAVLCYAPGIAEPAAIRLPIVEKFKQIVQARALRTRAA